MRPRGDSLLRLIHYSSAPLERIESVEQRAPCHKPCGLWFCADTGDDGWRRWCEAENFNLDRTGYRTALTFKRSARILRIKTASGIDRLTKTYSIDRPDISLFSIRWDKVAEKYDAIIIAPYIWQRRLGDALWYYTWDVASGCVWNADAVAKLTPLWNSPLLD